jgi:ubiquinone/menaquinone biosynthesis C-methylase UbiE
MTLAPAPADRPRLEVIAEAFSATAEKYDAFAEDHPHLTRMREKVHAHVARVVPPGARILELNAGTGTDAVALARRGYRVHATDIAPGMLVRAREKAEALPPDLAGHVTIQQLSFTDLDGVDGAPFDAVFSDLGGLNCTSDLRRPAASIRRVLRPAGIAVLVLMPPICLWELATALTGQFGLATRRLRPGGTRAHLEGRYFDVHYFTPERAIRALGRGWDVIGIEGLSVITPTAESRGLARRQPQIYRGLAWLDDRLAPRWPFREWGDFYILSARLRP